jgi:hypothetical protein
MHAANLFLRLRQPPTEQQVRPQYSPSPPERKGKEGKGAKWGKGGWSNSKEMVTPRLPLAATRPLNSDLHTARAHRFPKTDHYRSRTVLKAWKSEAIGDERKVDFGAEHTAATLSELRPGHRGERKRGGGGKAPPMPDSPYERKIPAPPSTRPFARHIGRMEARRELSRPRVGPSVPHTEYRSHRSGAGARSDGGEAGNAGEVDRARLCAYVCVCMGVCVRQCVHQRVCVCLCVRACVIMCVFRSFGYPLISLTHARTNTHTLIHTHIHRQEPRLCRLPT